VGVSHPRDNASIANPGIALRRQVAVNPLGKQQLGSQLAPYSDGCIAAAYV
jgi:hypothetical protein